MATATIFYSWQSDTDARTNRSFIEKALGLAIDRLASDATVIPALRDAELNLDKDTQGVAGSPPIAATILKKIEECSVFVADLTFVGETSRDLASRKMRLFPNPNVLIEYGYALRCHGHERLIGIVNTAFGESHSDNLPFDLRHLRWPITYEWTGAEEAQRDVQLEGLIRQLTEAIKLIFITKAPPQTQTLDFIPQASTKDPSVFFDNPSDLIGEVSFGRIPEQFIVPDEGRAYVRLYPAKAVPPIKSELEARLLMGKGGVWPMGDLHGCGHARNIFGAIAYEQIADGNLYNLTQLFLTREVWGLDALALNATRLRSLWSGGGKPQPAYIASSYLERIFVKALRSYLNFAQKFLELPVPLRVEAGLVGVKGYPITVSNFQIAGGCLTNQVRWQGEIRQYDVRAEEFLSTFFDHFWAKCGIVRPESQQAELTRLVAEA